MKNNKSYTLFVSVLLCLLPIVAGVIFYSRLPDEIPIHFDLTNQPDAFAPKPLALFGVPIFMAAIQALTFVLRAKVTGKLEKTPKMLTVVTWFVPVLTVFLYTIVLVYALGHPVNIGRYVLLLIGLFFCILANYMPKASYAQMKDYMHPMPKDEKTFNKVLRITACGLLVVGVVFLITAWLV